MDQHNFEMIHFKCTIPAIGCTIMNFLLYCVMQIHGLTLEFEVHASKRRLRWKKKKQYATCALDSTSPKEGEGGGEARGWDMCWL